MIRVSFVYPNTEDSHFDSKYYVEHHAALAREVFGAALKDFRVDIGIAGIEPGTPPPYHAAGHAAFETIEAFYEVLMPRLDELKGDVPNYTNVEPVITVSEVAFD